MRKVQRFYSSPVCTLDENYPPFRNFPNFCIDLVSADVYFLLFFPCRPFIPPIVRYSPSSSPPWLFCGRPFPPFFRLDAPFCCLMQDFPLQISCLPPMRFLDFPLSAYLRSKLEDGPTSPLRLPIRHVFSVLERSFPFFSYVLPIYIRAFFFSFPLSPQGLSPLEPRSLSPNELFIRWFVPSPFPSPNFFFGPSFSMVHVPLHTASSLSVDPLNSLLIELQTLPSLLLGFC